jgi:hypothetical protein
MPQKGRLEKVGLFAVEEQSRTGDRQKLFAPDLIGFYPSPFANFSDR